MKVDDTQMIAKWETLDSNFLGNYKVFDLYRKTRKHPKTRKVGDFTALVATDWVNIIPITVEQEIVLVEQYRHGIDAITLEIPAGIMEANENPKAAAERECIEETGYIGKSEAILLGKSRSNPAFLNNYCYHYLWLDCELKQEQHLDENEDIRIVKIPLSAIKNYIAENKIEHSLAISAFYHFFNRQSLAATSAG